MIQSGRRSLKPLVEGGVEFVLIGGAAIQSYGRRLYDTNDVDVVPNAEDANLARATIWNLATRHGQLDLTFAPSGFSGGYWALARNARPRRSLAQDLTVVNRRARRHPRVEAQADRPKDREYLRHVEG